MGGLGSKFESGWKITNFLVPGSTSKCTTIATPISRLREFAKSYATTPYAISKQDDQVNPF